MKVRSLRLKTLLTGIYAVRQVAFVDKLVSDRKASFLEGHYLLGAVWKRNIRSFLCLYLALLAHLFFLGVFYHFFGDDSAGSGFAAYDGQDALFYLWTVLIVTFLSLATTVTLRFLDKASAQQFIGRSLSVATTLVSVLFGVLIILADLGMCEKAAMKWGVGFLWCALTEVGVGEFAVAAVRYFLLKKAAKKESPKA